MYLLYSLFLISWGALLIPVLLYKAWRRRKYLPGLAQRFGKLPGILKSTGTPTIWFHACSVGETLSLQPLVQSLHRRFPNARFVFSTITQTGQLMAEKNFAVYGGKNTFYFPVDLASVVSRVLDWIRPAMIVIVDTEIWPNLVHQAYRRKIPVVLANGRISASSFRYYRLAAPVLRRVLRNYSLLMMVSDEDARRITAIGASPAKVLVAGNMKYDKSIIQEEMGKKAGGDEQAIFCSGIGDAAVIVAGSTHPGEEAILLEVLKRVRKSPGLSGTRMILAPRHPERFEEAASIISKNGFTLRRRSSPRAGSTAPDVLLLDTLGELATIYRLATLVFVGGTLVRRGGHSIMEPAVYSKAIVVGPSMENFGAIIEEFRRQGAVRQIDATEEERELQVDQLTKVFQHLLQNAQEREAIGETAHSILEKNRGAARLAADHIARIFGETENIQSSQAEISAEREMG